MKKINTAKKKITTKKELVPDVIVILKTEHNNDPYIKYFTGASIDYGLLLVLTKQKPVLFHSPLEKIRSSTKYATRVFEVKEVQAVCKTIKPNIIGYDAQHLSVAGLSFLKKTLGKATYVDVSKALLDKRSIKSRSEVLALQKAAAITQRILDKLILALPKFTFEKEAIAFLKQEALKENVKLSFEPIVASGLHARTPHYVPTTTARLSQGFCIIDFGVSYDGYCADISRTVFLGKPSAKEKEAYEQVKNYLFLLEKELSAHKKKIQPPWDIGHALGHGIGLHVHEKPLVGRDELQQGNVVAIEPALYTKELGIRIEDNYVVLKNSLKRISVGSRELIIIPFKK